MKLHQCVARRSNVAIILGSVIVLTATIGSPSVARAAVTFFSSPSAFSSAMSTAQNALIGTEDFEGSTLSAPSNANINDPLKQGVPNGQYPSGLVQPLQVQTNSLGGAASPSPGSILLLVPAGSRNAVSDVVVPASSAVSLDWITLVAPQGPIVGMGLNPIILQDGGTAHLQVFNQNNVLLGTFDTAADPAGTNFVGIQTTGGDTIGRINFLGTSGSFQRAGGDNAAIYVPEPGSMTILGIGTLLLIAFRIRR